MANTYRAVSARGIALHGEDVVDLDLSVIEEADMIAAGHLEIVPRSYRVLSNNYAAGEQGETVDLALPIEVEAALISGGHLVRVDPDETPAGNASRDEWADYALAHGASADDLVDEDGKPLGRNELREKYGSTDPHSTEKEV